MKKILTKNFVTCDLIGRLGNLMFQMSHAYVKSLEYNRQFCILKNDSIARNFENTLFKKIPFFDIDIQNIGVEVEEIHGRFEYTQYPPNDIIPTKYFGYYQSEKFFGNYGEVIRGLFSTPEYFIKELEHKYPFLFNSVVACVNVRRGQDYLEQPNNFPVVSKEYIYEAHSSLPQYDELVIISDNIDWCRANIKLPNARFIDEYQYETALWFMSICDHFIISNSTFSWWGSWLSTNDDKVVIAPDTWFGDSLASQLNPRDIYCDNWTTIPTKAVVNSEIVPT